MRYYLGAPVINHEAPDAMPPPWASAFSRNRGWPTRPVSSRVGPQPGMWSKLGAADTAPLYTPLSPIDYRGHRGLAALGDDWAGDLGGYSAPTFDLGVDTSLDLGQFGSAPDTGGGSVDLWGTPAQSGGSGGGGSSGGGGFDLGNVFSDISLNIPDVPDIFGTGGGGVAGPEHGDASQRTDTTGITAADVKSWIGAATGIVSPLLKALFPAGLPAAWTPCPKGTYYLGGQCHAATAAVCPTGYVWNGSTCAPASLLCSALGICGGDGGGGADGGGLSFTQGLSGATWFWPVVIGGGALVLYGLVRRH